LVYFSEWIGLKNRVQESKLLRISLYLTIMRKILFVCTGNYFRSRFAEIYFNARTASENPEWSAFSRGFDISNPNNLGFISEFALEELKQLEIYLPDKIELPLLITVEDLQQAEIIIALNESEHRPFVKRVFPDWEEKIVFWKVRDLYEVEAMTSLNRLKFELDNLIQNL